ncbi:MAG TPA: hypothetical protein VIZ68_07390, partial [Thermoplasmata archaeon]
GPAPSGAAPGPWAGTTLEYVVVLLIAAGTVGLVLAVFAIRSRRSGRSPPPPSPTPPPGASDPPVG